jgi:peptidoglycan hydrolase-like protein with peptidoglycan-binding domain
VVVTRRFTTAIALCVGILGATLVPVLDASSATSNVHSFVITSNLPTSLSSQLPLLRLHFSDAAKVKNLPALRTQPALATQWQQISSHEVQAVVTGSLRPAATYTIDLPTRMTCATTCRFTAVRPRRASVASSTIWAEQLLAELNYLPVSFTPNSSSSDPSQPTAGSFTWKYPNLPATLQSQWRVGVAGVILRGALMNFQSVNNIPTTGIADAATWSDLITAVQNHQTDPTTYDYVSVSQGSPEKLTLYVTNHVKFTTAVNTGISVSPTALGTYPVYERFLSTTMSGTNPDGSHYSDPNIQWVSYFNGGDALHEFPRYSYGFPQSLGCVEMPFASAETVFPFTPIGTLVTINS